MAVVRRKIPSQAASGAETFSDNLVGNQITDGSSQLTNTNFDIDRVIPEKEFPVKNTLHTSSKNNIGAGLANIIQLFASFKSALIKSLILTC